MYVIFTTFYRIPFIINDHIAISLVINADDVHLAQ